MIEFWRAGGPTKGNPVETARRVEAEGWDGQMFMDSQSLSADPYVLMGAWAAVTERIKLSTGVTNPLTRHPAVTAASAATIQTITGGRGVLGIGRGDSALAYLGYAPATLKAFERTLIDIQTLLSGGQVAFDDSLKGSAPLLESMSLGDAPTGAGLEWIPADMPKTPMDVAATGPKVIEMAAPIAERVTLSVGAIVDRMNWAVGLARDARTKKGLAADGVELGAQVIVMCHPDKEAVRQQSTNLVSSLARFQVIQGRAAGPMSNVDADAFQSIYENYDMTSHHKNDEGGKLGSATISQEFVERFAIVGDPDHCTRRLIELIDCGVQRFVIVGPGLHREYNRGGPSLFATEVIPAIRAARP